MNPSKRPLPLPQTSSMIAPLTLLVMLTMHPGRFGVPYHHHRMPAYAPSSSPLRQTTFAGKGIFGVAHAATIRMMGYDTAMNGHYDLLSRFEQATGHTVNITVLSSSELLDVMNNDITKGSGGGGEGNFPHYDIYQSPFAPFDHGLNGDAYDLTEEVITPKFDWGGVPFVVREEVTLDNHVFSIPIDSNPMPLMYRRDLIPQPPATWEELIDVATRFHGQDINNDSVPDFGICLITEDRWQMTLFSIANTVFRFSDSKRDGFLFDIQYDDTKPMESLIETEGWEYTLETMKKLYQVSQQTMLSTGFEAFNYWRNGSCATYIALPSTAEQVIKEPLPSIFNPNVTFDMRGKMGVTRTPGSTKVYNRQSKKMEECTIEMCPFKEYGSVNRPTYSDGLVQLVLSSRARNLEAALELAAWFTTKVDVRVPGSLNPFRGTHWNLTWWLESEPRPWLEEEARMYTETCYDIMTSPRTGKRPRVPTMTIWNTLIDEAMMEVARLGKFSSSPKTTKEILATLNQRMLSDAAVAGFDFLTIEGFLRKDLSLPPRRFIETPGFPAYLIVIITLMVSMMVGFAGFMLISAWLRGAQARLAPKESDGPNVTMLVVSIYKCSALWDRFPDAMPEALKNYRTTVRQVCKNTGCYEVKRIGDTNFVLAAKNVETALKTATKIQEEILNASWSILSPSSPSSSPAGSAQNLSRGGGTFLGQGGGSHTQLRPSSKYGSNSTANDRRAHHRRARGVNNFGSKKHPQHHSSGLKLKRGSRTPSEISSGQHSRVSSSYNITDAGEEQETVHDSSILSPSSRSEGSSIDTTNTNGRGGIPISKLNRICPTIGIQNGPVQITHDVELDRYDYSGAPLNDAALLADLAVNWQIFAGEGVFDTVSQTNTSDYSMHHLCTWELSSGSPQELYSVSSRKLPSVDYVPDLANAAGGADGGNGGDNDAMAALEQATAGLTSKKVTVLAIRITEKYREGNSAVVAGGKNREKTINRISALHKAIEDEVRRSKGHVHSSASGEIMITFNAAKTVADSVRRAALLAIELNTLISSSTAEELQGWSFSSGLANGPALVGKLEALGETIYGPVIDRALALRDLCARYQHIEREKRIQQQQLKQKEEQDCEESTTTTDGSNQIAPTADEPSIFCLTHESLKDELSTCAFYQFLDCARLPVTTAAPSSSAAKAPKSNPLNFVGGNDGMVLAAPKDHDQPPPPPLLLPTPILAIMSVREAAEDEWMYELEAAAENDPCLSVNLAWDLLFEASCSDLHCSGHQHEDDENHPPVAALGRNNSNSATKSCFSPASTLSTLSSDQARLEFLRTGIHQDLQTQILQLLLDHSAAGDEEKCGDENQGSTTPTAHSPHSQSGPLFLPPHEQSLTTRNNNGQKEQTQQKTHPPHFILGAALLRDDLLPALVARFSEKGNSSNNEKRKKSNTLDYHCADTGSVYNAKYFPASI